MLAAALGGGWREQAGTLRTALGERLAALGGLLRGSVMSMAGGLASQLVKAVVIILVARIHGAGPFGQFSFAMAVNAFLTILAHFGLPLYGAREVATAGAPARDLVLAIGRARMLLAVTGTVAALALLRLLSGITPAEFGLIAGFGASNVAQAWFADWIYLGLGRLHGWAAVNFSFQALWLLFSLPALRGGGSIVAVGWAAAAASVCVAVLGWLRVRGCLRSGGGMERATVGGVLRTGTHMGTGQILHTALVWSDVAILRLAGGEEAAGIYAAGNRVALALSMLSSFYVQGAFAEMVQAAARGREEFARVFARVYGWLAWIFVPGALWSCFYARSIVTLLFRRPEYQASAPVFALFSLVMLATMLGVGLYGNGVLLAWRADRIFQRGLAVALVLFGLCAPWAAHRWGAQGMAGVALGAQLVVVGLYEGKIGRFVRPRHVRAVLAPAMAGLGAGVAGRLLGLELGGALLLLAGGYAVSGGWIVAGQGGAGQA